MIVELVRCLLLGAMELSAGEVSCDTLVLVIGDQILCQAFQHLYRVRTVARVCVCELSRCDLFSRLRQDYVDTHGLTPWVGWDLCEEGVPHVLVDCN